MTNHSTTSKNPFDIFIVGLRKGLDIGLYSLLPNVLMAFVLTYMLNLFGVMKFLGDTCGGRDGSLRPSGRGHHGAFSPRGSPCWCRCRRCRQPGPLPASSNAHDVTILAPPFILMASQIQYMGRLLGVANCPKKYWPLLMFNSVFMACLGMIVMRFVA